MIVHVRKSREHGLLLRERGQGLLPAQAGGLRVNDVVVSDEKLVLTPYHLTPEAVIKLSRGRKRHVLLKMGE